MTTPELLPLPPRKRSRVSVSTSISRTLLTTGASHSSIRVTLSSPGEDEECPLSLNPMKEDELPFLPNATFSRMFPTFRKMTLPCSHSFGAMQLLYHFARNQARCPLCRQGVNDRLDSRSIPYHCRRQIMRRVEAQDEVQVQEREASERVLLTTLFTQFLDDLSSYLNHVYLQVQTVQGTDLFQFKLNIFVPPVGVPTNALTSMAFTLSPADCRALWRHLEVLGLRHMRMQMVFRRLLTAIEPISSSDLFSTDFRNETRTIAVDQGSLRIEMGATGLQNILWTVPINYLMEF